MMHIKWRRAVPGSFEDVSPAGDGTFISNCIPTIPWRDVFLTALQMRRMRRPRMQIRYADFAGRQAACSRIDYPCRVDLAFSVLKWYRGGVAPEGVKRRMHNKTGDSQCLAAAAFFAHKGNATQNNGVGDRQCQTLTWVC